MIQGIYAAAITPRRRGQQDIDLGATWDLIDFLSSKKVDGIVLMGSTGEFVHFSVEERIRLMSLAAKRSRVPVIVNVSHSTLDGAVELARQTSSARAAGLVVMPPYFFRYRQDDVETFFNRFAQEAQPEIPTLLYNIPLFTTEITQTTTARLFASGRYAGIKDSSGNWEHFEGLLAAAAGSQMTLMMGNDLLFARSKAAGASGVISGVACAVPELLVALNKSLQENTTEVAARLEVRLNQFIGWIDKFPVPVGIKEATALRGIKTGAHSTELSEPQQQSLGEFRDWFRGWLPQVQKECSLA
ncbi:MAG TPA: dihydrodipicolinate synthase family protein [Bryobacteraceae bacterium]|nr:dihydrodipicolinate synthase family protein [Bryobacteraceae bacterium]